MSTRDQLISILATDNQATNPTRLSVVAVADWLIEWWNASKSGDLKTKALAEKALNSKDLRSIATDKAVAMLEGLHNGTETLESGTSMAESNEQAGVSDVRDQRDPMDGRNSGDGSVERTAEGEGRPEDPKGVLARLRLCRR